jgi:hypothetical protein
MDFKSRHPVAPIWDREMTQLSWPEPYDNPSIWSLYTITPNDGSGTFLVYRHSLPDVECTASGYAIEAPLDCPVRQAFETGEMSWMDYWHHKDWLLYVTIPLMSRDPITTRYISPRDIAPYIIERFKEFGNQGPYELKRQILELGWEYASWDGGCTKEAERKYRDFMLRNAGRFPRNAA